MAHLPQIQHDLAHPKAPKTVFGFICAALTQRRAAGTAAFTVMSCDNLPHNGAVTRKALLAFAALHDAELHDWIARPMSTFPNAMVDRITPMTSTAHRLQLHDEHGHRRCLAGGVRAVCAVGAGRQVRQRPPGLGKGRRAVHR